MTKYEKIENYILEEIDQLTFQKNKLEQKLTLNKIELESFSGNRMSLSDDSYDTGDIFHVDNSLKKSFTSDIDNKLQERINYINSINSDIIENIELINIKISKLSSLLNDDSNDLSIDNSNYLVNILNLECARLSRDLHDSSIQNITAVIRKQELLKKTFIKDINRGMIEIDNCISILKSVNEELRDDIYYLRNISSDRIVSSDEGDKSLFRDIESGTSEVLFNHLKSYFNEKINEVISKYDNLDFEINYNIDDDIFEKNILFNNMSVFHALINVISELISNSVKYSDGNSVVFEVKLEKKTLVFIYSDNGKGFDYYNIINQHSNASNVKYNSSKFGLKIIQERINLLKGNINFVNKVDNIYNYKYIIKIPVIY